MVCSEKEAEGEVDILTVVAESPRGCLLKSTHEAGTTADAELPESALANNGENIDATFHDGCSMILEHFTVKIFEY